MEIRLLGKIDDVEKGIKKIESIYMVVNVSKTYKSRDGLVKVSLKVRDYF